MVLRRTFEYFTAVVLKRTNWTSSSSTAAAVWRQLTTEKTEAGLVAVWWWLEECRLVITCQLVKTAVVC